MTVILSSYIYVGLEIGILIILSLYQKAYHLSSLLFMAINYTPKTDEVIVDSFFKYQLINDMYKKIMTLVLDLPVDLLQACTCIHPSLCLLTVQH